MATTIPISDCTLTRYRYYLKNTTAKDQYIPLYVINLPYKLSELDQSIIFSGVLDTAYGYFNIRGIDFGLTGDAPVWIYNTDRIPSVFLEIYTDELIRINVEVTKNSGSYGYNAHYSLTGLTNGENVFTTAGNCNTYDSTTISLTFFRTSDDRYLGNNVIFFGLLSNSRYRSQLVKSAPNPGVSAGIVDESNVRMYYASSIPAVSELPYEDWIRSILKVSKKYRKPDKNDPNDGGGNSEPGGGGGDGDIGGDTNPDDGLPTISALDSGLLTAYNPTVADLQSLGRFLWSDGFDVSTFKKLFNDPFDTLLGLSVVPVNPNTSGTKNIMFGNMDSGVSAPVVSNQWVSKDMGSVTLNEVWHGALDYAPSTGVTIYLPFIGMRQLNVNDVMGSSLHLIYKFDVLTGACIAQIYVNHSSQGNKNGGFSWTTNQGLVYEFIGQCAENIPLASQDFTNTIRAAIGGVSVAAGAAASVATGNPALGMAALTVGMANSGMQASTPTVERGGHLSGSASIMGYGQPFLIVERPHQCKPERYYALRGVPSQVYTSKLSKCTGFTQITANNNLHIAGASDSELAELQNLLVAGVYFPDKKR